MKKHRRKTTGRLSALLSLLLVATMAQPLFQTRAAENDVTMDGNVTWSYLDDGSDPAGDSIAAVPEKAVCEKSEGQYYVYTINDDGYRLAVDVTVGETVDGSTIIKSGLTAGEQVTIN